MADERVLAVVQGVPVRGGNGLQGVEEAGEGMVGKDRPGGSRMVLAGLGWFVSVGGEENLNSPSVCAGLRNA